MVYEASYLKSKPPIPLICFWIIACLSLLSDIVKVVKLNNTCTVTRDLEIELPYTQKFPWYVNFADFTVTYRYSENLIHASLQQLEICNST